MKTSSKTLFLIIMIMSTVMVLSSSTWINMWIGLEMNLMSFIPLMSTSKNSLLSQSTMMYFLIQTMASMMFIALILTNKYMFLMMNSNFIKTVISITMMMKMGMPPFHMWFPEVMTKMSWIMCLTLMTWQKIAPMFIMSVVLYMNKTIIMMICLSAIIGAVGGINQTSTQKMMAYSSMNHMSWLMACAATYKKSWMMYMFVYTMMIMMLSIMLYNYNILYTNQMNIFFNKNIDKITVMIMMLSIGGMPPFLGFLPKWMAIQYMISSNELIMMFIMTSSAVITLSYYLRMSSSMNMMMSQSQTWMKYFLTKKKMSTYMFNVNMLLPMIIFSMNFM